MKEEKVMEEIKQDNDLKINKKPDVKVLEDIDDFIFNDEGYKCSER